MEVRASGSSSACPTCVHRHLVAILPGYADSPGSSVACATGAVTSYKALVLIWKVATVLRWTLGPHARNGPALSALGLEELSFLGGFGPVSTRHARVLPQSGLDCLLECRLT